MAPRPSRRRRDAGEHPEPGEPDPQVDLGAEEHAWWAQTDITEAWTPQSRRPVVEPDQPEPPTEPERDVLAEHFGADWRTSFGFDAAADPPAETEPATAPQPEPPTASEPPPAPLPELPADTSDPYLVLGVEPSASWEDIVAAHRGLARHYHPDRVLGRPSAEVASAEEGIRAINAAYRELRVRRGR